MIKMRFIFKKKIVAPIAEVLCFTRNLTMTEDLCRIREDRGFRLILVG